jgi:hypothetical protein
METNFAAEHILKWLLGVQGVLANQILTPDNLSQIPAVFITFVLAWIIARAGARRFVWSSITWPSTSITSRFMSMP